MSERMTCSKVLEGRCSTPTAVGAEGAPTSVKTVLETTPLGPATFLGFGVEGLRLVV